MRFSFVIPVEIHKVFPHFPSKGFLSIFPGKEGKINRN